MANMKTGVAATLANRCADAQVVLQLHSSGSSIKESPFLSPSTCTVTEEVIREREIVTPHLRQAQQRHTARFLAGPIPISTIAAAGALPGRALLVLLAIHHRVKLTGQPWVSLPQAVMKGFGFNRFAKSRAVTELEGANLIRVTRKPGRTALVSLCRGSSVHP